MTAENQLCGFVSVLPFPHPRLRNAYRGHRLVILPDFQGIGLGHYLSCWLGEHLNKFEKKLISITTNPAVIASRKKDSQWTTTRLGRVCRQGNEKKFKRCSRGRFTASFAYIPKK
jgi:hypothetical protein